MVSFVLEILPEVTPDKDCEKHVPACKLHMQYNKMYGKDLWMQHVLCFKSVSLNGLMFYCDFLHGLLKNVSGNAMYNCKNVNSVKVVACCFQQNKNLV
jgi:hypothetical protein